jgi:hypothetical protein
MEITNAKNTICNFKRLIGRRYHDIYVQQEKDLSTYSIVEGKGGSVNIEVTLSLRASPCSSTMPLGELSQRTKTVHTGADRCDHVWQIEADHLLRIVGESDRLRDWSEQLISA